jgi:hypothetical protein
MLPRTMKTLLTIGIGGIGLQNLSVESALLGSEAEKGGIRSCTA